MQPANLYSYKTGSPKEIPHLLSVCPEILSDLDYEQDPSHERERGETLHYVCRLNNVLG